MKNIKKILFYILLIFVVCPTIVSAETSLNTPNQRPVVGTVIDVTMQIDYGTKNKISEAHYKVHYDPVFFEFVELTWTQSEGSYSVENGVITIDKNANSLPWTVGGPIVIKLKTIHDKNSKIEIKENGVAKYTDGSIVPQTYSGITINAVNPSTETLLNKLYVEGYTLFPTFNNEEFNYSLKVPSNVTRVNIGAVKGTKEQIIEGTGTRVLSYGDNKVRVVVTAQNGDQATYEIIINRDDDRSGDVSLKKLIVKNTDIEFKEGQTNFETIVSRSIDKIFIEAQTTDPKAQLVGTGERSLTIGENIFNLEVSSSNNKKQIYTIKVIRSEEEFATNEESTLLKDLAINNTIINLDDKKTTYLYSVDKDTNILDFAITTKSNTAKYKINQAKELKTGFNIVTINVTDNKLPETKYKIIVYKQPQKTTLYTSFEELNAALEINQDVYFLTNNNENSIIPKDILKKIKNNKFYYNLINEEKGLIYQLIIPSSLNDIEINTKLSKTTETPLTYETELPENIQVTLYVGDKYRDGVELKIFTYENIGQYTYLTKGVKVTDGYITFTTNGAKNYVFTNQELIASRKTFNILDYIPFILFGGVVFFLIVYIILKKKKSKNVTKTNEPLY